MATRILLTLTVLLLIWAVPACSTPVTAEDWQRDLQQLRQELATRHVDLHHTVSAEDFSAAADELHARIPSLSAPEILVGFAQLVALVGDGHTSFFAGNQKGQRFGHYPLILYAFSEGIHVTAAAAEHRHLLGKRLVQIDDTPIAEVWRLVSTVVGADNAMEYRYTVPFEIIRPELLHALGIAGSAERVEFAFADGTREVLTALDLDQWHNTEKFVVNPLFGPEGKAPTTRHEALFATALTAPHLMERKYYWYTHLADHDAVFMQYNACWDQKDRPPFAAVADEMLAFMEQAGAERLIIDLRQNTGGEPRVAEPLVDALESRSDLASRGGLFVLMSRRTYSAALTNAAQLRARAGARIVGEPSRGKPNHPSEGRDIDLEATGLWATVSTEFVARDPALADADFLPVDIPVELSFADYARGLDPVLQAALEAPLRGRTTP